MKKNLIYFLSLFFIASCKNSTDCDFVTEDCGKFIKTVDFEAATVNTVDSWTGINAHVNIVYYPQSNNKSLQLIDGNGTSSVYKVGVLPSNLLATGCKLYYDVSLNLQNTSTDIGVIIFDNNIYLNSIYKATFRLNADHLVNGDGLFQTIVAPLELANNGKLPNNEYGQWEISPSSTPQNDVQNFNHLIQNSSGIAFTTDIPGKSGAVFYIDNIKIKTCCPTF